MQLQKLHNTLSIIIIIIIEQYYDKKYYNIFILIIQYSVRRVAFYTKYIYAITEHEQESQ